MAITVTIRPGGARTEVRGLPWEGPGAGYRIVGEAIDATRQDQVKYAHGSFTVARARTESLILSLAKRYGRVHVVQFAGQTKCVAACWAAKPETALECECSCAGVNHGSGRALERTVDQAEELSVSRAHRREFDVYG